MEREFIVLSVEDNPDDRLILQQAFRRAGRPTVLRSVADGDEARDYLMGIGSFQDRGSHPAPSLILLDLKLPKRSGHEILEWMKTRPELRQVPVIILTSSTEPRDLRRTYELGVTSYFVKPTRFEDIVSLVQCLTNYWFVLNQWPPER